ncbi:hypothetical protein [Psychrobacter sp.]|uniref:hypothetical protein n=1 Tax=Psychrobacter sp. TaxID=56811 RepID=UPI00264A16E0|nr:hypothetical protein [Psychrobacter sp.]MDN6275250.1 hypothetical protein [Psychrobacter sp.]MDN6308966.1 hypothetical protein [Psychrobacter sp.]
MTTKKSISPRLPIMLTAGFLSTGLLLSGCSNSDNAEANSAGTESVNSANGTEDTAAAGGVTEADSAGQAETAADEAMQAEDNADDATMIASDDINPLTDGADQQSLLTNPTEPGTPEDTVKKALDSLYYGDVEEAAKYYEVDMANFEEELAKTQSAFQQTVDGVTITNTEYNDDETRATIAGELMLKEQDEPAPLTYVLQKIDGQWKILG